MQLSKLKALSADQCWQGYLMGKVTHFECMFRDYLTGAIDWPEYGPEDIVKLRERFNLTQEALAALLGVSPKSVLRWETEGESIPTPIRISLCTLDRLGDGLFDLMKGTRSLIEFSRSLTGQNLTRGTNSAAYSIECKRRDMGNPVPMNFDKGAVSDLQGRLRMNRREFAQALGVSQSTVDKWKSGAVAPSGSALTLLKILWLQGASALPH